jgi:hypothetical protein
MHIVFSGKARIQDTTRKLRHMWEDKIELDLRQIGWDVALDSSGSG